MKFFIDCADPVQIKKYWDAGIIDGVTTNPTLATKVGRPFKDLVLEILAIVDGPVSLEVLSTDHENIIKEARSLSLLHKNVIVKVPLIEEGIRAVKQLSGEGIKTNVTLCFSPAQAILAAKAGATYVSPFLGRLEDIGEESMMMLKEIVQIFDRYNFATNVLAASIRTVRQVEEAAMIGADVATIPPEVLEKLYKHPLTDKGLEQFLADYQKSGMEPLIRVN
jgi:transaldolase